MVTRVKSSQGTMALSCSQAKLWVKTHYERHEDGVVAKSVMYKHYEDYCREQGRNIMETSIFGRVVKSVFPDVTIRRLGGRDNLKYYYCGIQAKETSPHAVDNATTTRPKRRLRKRELVTDKADVHRCLVWLRKNYVAGPEGSVVKPDVYERYVQECISSGLEPLTLQYFGMVVTHAFPHITKRKLGPRANQQKYYFGIQERAVPLLPFDGMQAELLGVVDEMFSNGRLCYREDLNAAGDEDDEDDDYSCRSPLSDTSEGSLRDTNTPYGCSDSIQAHSMTHYMLDNHHYIKEEPVDYSLSHLRLKDEPPEEVMPQEEHMFLVKEEPLDLHTGRVMVDHQEYSSQVDYSPEMDNMYTSSRSPDRSSPSVTTSMSNSPSPSVKDQKTKRIYKPRFHIDYHDENSWISDSTIDPKSEQLGMQYSETEQESFLRHWLLRTFEEYDRMSVNRYQVYAYYERHCELSGTSPLLQVSFDEIVLKEFRGVVTRIHSSDKKTFYEGIRVQSHSELFNHIEELFDGEPFSWKDMSSQHSMEMSPPAGAAPIDPLTLPPDDEEDDQQDDTYGENYQNAESPEDDLHSSTPEVLRDGKYYLRMWLTDNFESVTDACVLKADAYKHYEIYARSIKQNPFEMNVFGKIVRQVFPKVTIRRLGGRVKPQYHYCGIAVKASSPIFQYMSGRDPAQRSRKKEIATDNKSAEIVIDWLRRMYEPGKERIIMKSEVFKNYCNYCTAVNENPVTLNYFGKLVKHCFPSVEVRKFGGRSEPTWYYFGLVPRGVDHHLSSPQYPGDMRREASPLTTDHPDLGSLLRDPDDLTGSPYDLQVPAGRGMVSISPRHLSPAASHDDPRLPGLPPHSTSPIPISLAKGGGAPSPHYNTPPNGSYGSPSSILVQSMLQNQLQASYAQSPLLNRRGAGPGYPQHQSSPRDSLQCGDNGAPPPVPLHTGVVRPSPIDAHHRSFHENLNSHSPAEGARMQELRRHLLARSPYEPADLPPDNLYSRSPGDTAAQYCRSPRDDHHTTGSPGPGGHHHQPGDTIAIMFAAATAGQSPVSSTVDSSTSSPGAGSFRQRAYLSGGGTVVAAAGPGGGGSGNHAVGPLVGPGSGGSAMQQQQQAALAGLRQAQQQQQQHKRHKLQLHHQHHHHHHHHRLDDYEMVQDMAVE